jgi:hypothetical protein
VVEHGTLPNDELYLDLVPFASNGGAVNHQELLGLSEQSIESNADGEFQLFRIGDAVSSRNVHAAIYDALPVCLAICEGTYEG